MIRKFRGRERGMSAIPFVVSLLLVAGFAIAWYNADQAATDLKGKLTNAQRGESEWRTKQQELNNELLALTEVTGYGSQDPANAGKPDRAALQAALNAALDQWREKATLEFTADKYQAVGTGGIIEKLQGDKVRVSYVPAKDQIQNPTVQALLPILNSAAGRLLADVKRGFEEKGAAVAANETLAKARDESLAAKDAEIARVRAEGDQAKRTLEETVRELRDQKQNAEQALQQAQLETEAVKTEAAAKEAALSAKNSQLAAELQTLVRRDQPFLTEAPDGEVVGAGAGVVIVNRGRKDMLMPGTTFEVLGRIKGGELVPKGAIKVIVCNETSAECKILSESSGNPINGGDLIQSKTYSPNRVMHFALIGEFRKMGRAQAEARLKALGAQVDSQVTSETHYLVVGAPPAGENLEDSDAYKAARQFGVTPITEAQLASFTLY